MRQEVGRAGWTVAAALASAIVLAPGMVLAQDVTLRGTTITLTDILAHTRMGPSHHDDDGRHVGRQGADSGGHFRCAGRVQGSADEVRKTCRVGSE
jgi:hypothetical protein